MPLVSFDTPWKHQKTSKLTINTLENVVLVEVVKCGEKQFGVNISEKHNTFQPSVAFHIETSILISTIKGLVSIWNTRLSWNGWKSAIILTFFFPVFPFDPPENIRFSDVFRGIKREHWEKKELNSEKGQMEITGVFRNLCNKQVSCENS